MTERHTAAPVLSLVRFVGMAKLLIPSVFGASCQRDLAVPARRIESQQAIGIHNGIRSSRCYSHPGGQSAERSDRTDDSGVDGSGQPWGRQGEHA